MATVFLLSAAPLSLQAAQIGETNQTILSFPAEPDFALRERSDLLGERFLQEVASSDSIVFDHFVNPAARLTWERRQDALGYSSLNQINRDGTSLFTSIALNSLRTAAIEILPFQLWEDAWLSRVAGFIAGTIGNPQEEHIDVTSISYSDVRSNWERENEGGKIQWGVRPWRTNPYVYLLAHAGHFDGRPLITFEGRAGYSFFNSTHLEGRLTLQLPDDFRIACGATLNSGFSGSANRIGITLERAVRSTSNCPLGVCFIGFRSGSTGNSSNRRLENLFLFGLSRVW